ncbi:MAG TPA: trypsin-like peptidase domain-containing protein [Candidatus Enterenecus stercoripullorum]|nr:trypsin-like peptidase domain-containing protein [Candidatus Enterenecus stercoripullorum]
MQNHLSYRWPTGPSLRSVPYGSPKPPLRRLGRAARTLLIVIGCLAGLALLIFAAFWGVLTLAGYFSNQIVDAPPLPTGSISRPQSDGWSPDDLPWGDPDPAVEISLSQPAYQLLTAQEIYQQVLPSVVCVQAGHGESYSVGSGVILTSGGYIATNYHVIEKGSDLEVMLLSTQRVYDAVLIGYDEELDLAVLKVDAQGLTPARLADSDQLQVGDQVYAIGNPMGYLYGTMTDGIVSSLAREVEVDSRDMTLIQTSAALNSGNSGGALVDAYGQVVGITSAKITGVNDDVVTEGIGLAIPITDSLPFLNYIIQTGKTCRPALGVTCNIHTVEGQQRVIIAEISPGAPAEGILEPEDEVIALNGQPFDTFYQLTRILYATGVGNPVELTVLRNGQEIIVSVTLYDSLTATSQP